MTIRRLLAAAFVLPAVTACIVIGTGPGAFAAVVGVYADWTLTVGTPTTGTAAIAAAGFPSATLTTTSTAPSVAGGGTAFLNPTTPVGAEFGSSQNQEYLSLRTATGFAPSSTTITFATLTPATGWGFALGDVDADSVAVAATGPSGALTTAELGWRSAFNYCSGTPLPSTCGGLTGTDLPTWNTGTAALVGAGTDTNGASGWFTPTVPVTSLTLTFSRQIGSPAYQLWLVGSAVPTPTPTATTTPVETPSETVSETPSETISETPTETATATSSSSASTTATSSPTAAGTGAAASPTNAPDPAGAGAGGSGGSGGGGPDGLATTGAPLALLLGLAVAALVSGGLLRSLTHDGTHR